MIPVGYLICIFGAISGFVPRIFSIITPILAGIIVIYGEFALRYTKITLLAFLIGLLIANIYSYGKAKYVRACGNIYIGAGISCILSENFLEFFCFFELMTFAALAIIFKYSYEAGKRYLMTHFLSASLLLCAIANSYVIHKNFDIDFSHSKILFLSAFLINAGLPFFGKWLTTSYNSVTPEASLYLINTTTKLSIFFLLNYFSGEKLLFYPALMMIIYGLIYSILESNLRKILTFMIIAQCGFMIIAITLGSNIANDGVAIYLFSHILYNSLLFIGYNYVGLASLIAFPLTLGYVAKTTILISSIAESKVYLFLLISSFCNMFVMPIIKKIKIEEDLNHKIAQIIPVSLIILLGVFYKSLFYLIGEKNFYIKFYDFHNLSKQFLLLGSEALLFWALYPILKKKNRKIFEIDFIDTIQLFLKKSRLLMNNMVKNSAGRKFNELRIFNKFSLLPIFTVSLLATISIVSFILLSIL